LPAITGFFGALARKFSFPSLGALARKFLLPLGALTGLFGALALKFLLPLGALTASSARWRTSSFSLSAVSIPADHWNPEKAETDSI
jgi:hypothetical protein